MQKILQIGFRKYGVWKNDISDIERFKDGLPDNVLNNSHFIYAYIIDKKVFYIGKSDRTPLIRLRNGWAKNKKKLHKINLQLEVAILLTQ